MKNLSNGVDYTKYQQNNQTVNNNIANLSAKDPSYALGLLLGRAISSQYEDRGTKKLYDSLMGSDGKPKQETAPQPFNPDDYSFTQGGDNLFTKYSNPQYRQVNPLSVDFLKDIDIGANQPLSDTERQVYQGMVNPPLKQQNSPLDEAAWNYLNYKIDPNQTPVDPNLPPPTAEEWQAKVLQAGMAQGRPISQIQAVMELTSPMVQADRNKYVKDEVARLRTDLLNNLPKDVNDLEAAGEMIDKMARIRALDKGEGDFMAAQMPTGRNFATNEANMNSKIFTEQLAEKHAQSTLANNQALYGYKQGLDLQAKAAEREQRYNVAIANGYTPEAAAMYAMGGKIGTTTGGKADTTTETPEMTAEEKKLNKTTSDEVYKLYNSLYNLATGKMDTEEGANAIAALDNYMKELPYSRLQYIPQEYKDRITHVLYAANAKREAAANHHDMAKKYADALPDSVKQEFGINF